MFEIAVVVFAQLELAVCWQHTYYIVRALFVYIQSNFVLFTFLTTATTTKLVDASGQNYVPSTCPGIKSAPSAMEILIKCLTIWNIWIFGPIVWRFCPTMLWHRWHHYENSIWLTISWLLCHQRCFQFQQRCRCPLLMVQPLYWSHSNCKTILWPFWLQDCLPDCLSCPCSTYRIMPSPATS